MDRPAGAARVEAALAEVLPGREPALHIDAVVERARLLLRRLGVSGEVWDERLTVRTVRYYRSKGIVSAPRGEGPNARYGRRHVLEAAAARLAGHLHHLSLADAAERIAALDDAGLAALLAELAAREAEDAAPRPLPGVMAAPLAPQPASAPAPDDDLDDDLDDACGADGLVGEPTPLLALPLPKGVTLLIPENHLAFRCGASPEQVGRAVATALDRLTR